MLAGTLKEVAARNLAAREETRVGAALAVAVERISTRLIAGHSLRSDDFFRERIGGRTPSAEIFDAVLLKARDSYEERKVRHLGLMFANLAFSPDVSFEAANLLVKQFDQLTYRQLCILALIEQNCVLDVEALRRPEHQDPEIEALKREEMDLFGNDLGTFWLIVGGDRPRDWSDKLSVRGAVLHRLAALNEIPASDLEPIEYVLSVLRSAYTQ